MGGDRRDTLFVADKGRQVINPAVEELHTFKPYLGVDGATLQHCVYKPPPPGVPPPKQDEDGNCIFDNGKNYEDKAPRIVLDLDIPGDEKLYVEALEAKQAKDP